MTDVIMFQSDEAAHYQTNLSGWVSRGGLYFGSDERAARYSGCTHRPCEICGEPVEKGWLTCVKCRELKDEAAYNAMPEVEWDETGMVYSDIYNQWFSSWGEIEDYCEDDGIEINELRLIICEPQYLPIIDSDYGCDELAEDGELPDSVKQAIEEFNKVIQAAGPVSWIPGNKKVKI